MFSRSTSQYDLVGSCLDFVIAVNLLAEIGTYCLTFFCLCFLFFRP